MRKLLLITVLLVYLIPAIASDSNLKLTIYNRGIAQVTQVKQFHLSRGENWITFAGVPKGIIAETVYLEPAKSNSKITVKQFDFLDERLDVDLLFRTSIDQYLDLTIDDEPVQGRLINFDDKYLYLEPDSGGVNLIKRADLDDLSFPEIPDGIVSQPTLYVQADNGGKPGEAELSLNYLTSGISWSAYYNAVYDNGKIELSGNFVIENELEMGFDGAELSLVAGEAHMAYDKIKLPRSGDEILDGNPALNDGEPFFAYYIYPVTMKVNLPAKSMKQIPLIDKKTYQAVEKNVMKEGFGLRNLDKIVSFTAPDIPLPEGEIAVHKKDKSGGLHFAGEDHLYGTPAGGEVEVKIGRNFDLQGERRRVSHQRHNRNETEDVIQVKLINGTDKSAKAVVRERVFGVWEIISAEFNGAAVDYKVVDSRKIEFEVDLAKNSTSILEYKVRYEY